MPNNQISVGQAVKFQLDKSDEDCSQGSGIVTQVIADVVAIRPDAGVCGVEELHRILFNGKLMLTKPSS